MKHFQPSNNIAIIQPNFNFIPLAHPVVPVSTIGTAKIALHWWANLVRWPNVGPLFSVVITLVGQHWPTGGICSGPMVRNCHRWANVDPKDK